MSLTLDGSTVTVAELVAAIGQQRRGTAKLAVDPLNDAISPSQQPEPSETIVVMGAHPGAGTSCVAVALAEAAARRPDAVNSGTVRLIDTAPTGTSGLLCAADRELGVDPRGWSTGRRGAVEFYRPVGPAWNSDTVAELLVMFKPGRLVVDAGLSCPSHQDASHVVRDLRPTATVVLVCRASVPGVRRAEQVLADLPGDPIVVGIGSRRWPGPVRATFGSCLADAHSAGRIMVAPRSRRLEVTGIDAQPLPTALVTAAARVLDLIWSTPRTPFEQPERGRV